MHDPLNVEPEDDVFTRRTRASLYARTREPCVVDSPRSLEDFVVFSSLCLLCLSRDPPTYGKTVLSHNSHDFSHISRRFLPRSNEYF